MRLKTTLIKEEGGRAYYEAATPGFSVFAIVLERDGATVAAPVSTPAPVATVGGEEEKDGEEPDVVEPEVADIDAHTCRCLGRNPDAERSARCLCAYRAYRRRTACLRAQAPGVIVEGVGAD